MPNQEHVELLKQSKQDTEVWNRWRHDNPNIKPDLSRADLSRLILPGIDFKNTNLSFCNLIGTILTEADLTRATLIGANLGVGTIHKTIRDIEAGKSWSGVHELIDGANLTDTILDHADLSSAQLHGVRFHNTSLKHTHFYQAYIYETILH